MSRTNIITILTIVVIVASAAVATYMMSSDGAADHGNRTVAEQLQEGEGLPYTNLAGEPVDLSAYEGDVLVINSWASWCPFCVNELPDLGSVATEFKDRGVSVIAINRAESPATARAFIDHVGDPSDVVFLLDPKDRFYTSIGGFSMPETVFYEADGDIAVHKRGFMSLEEMREHVDAALNERNKDDS